MSAIQKLFDKYEVEHGSTDVGDAAEAEYESLLAIREKAKQFVFEKERGGDVEAAYHILWIAVAPLLDDLKDV